MKRTKTKSLSSKQLSGKSKSTSSAVTTSSSNFLSFPRLAKNSTLNMFQGDWNWFDCFQTFRSLHGNKRRPSRKGQNQTTSTVFILRISSIMQSKMQAYPHMFQSMSFGYLESALRKWESHLYTFSLRKTMKKHLLGLRKHSFGLVLFLKPIFVEFILRRNRKDKS